MADTNYLYRFILDAKNYINASCAGLEPWQIIAYTMTSLFLIFFIKKLVDDILDDGVQRFWRILRSLPYIKQSVEKKMKNTSDIIEGQLLHGLEDKKFLKALPITGWEHKNIIDEVEKYLSYGNYEWTKGYVSGTVYSGNDKGLPTLMKDVYSLTAYTNPLHPDVFPGIRIMEAEILQMVSKLFHAPSAVGTVTTGGTESILMACKAYRDYARYVKGIKYPNIVIPVTAHAAFDKAAQFLNIKVKHIKFDPKTTKVDLKAMKKAVDSNTCMVVGSAPAFPHGSIDDIQEIAKLGSAKNIPVHVDACLGGFLIPFMEKAGYPLPPFDFRVHGVTSISIDTHKYAYAPKGTSIILYRDKIYRHYQYSVQPNWPGGMYGTPTMSGSRSGGIIATCWASLLYHGEDTYVECTRKIISVTKHIVNALRQMKEIYIIGQPDVSVISIGSNVFDVYRLSSGLNEKGWNLSSLQFPSGIHISITLQHTYEGVADKFISDVQECIAYIMKCPGLPTSGTAAIYGMAQQIPDRSLVSELVWMYLDACYSANNPSENGSIH